MRLKDLRMFTAGRLDEASVSDFAALMRIQTALRLERCGLAAFDGLPAGTALAKEQLNLNGTPAQLLERIDYILNDYLDYRAVTDLH